MRSVHVDNKGKYILVLGKGPCKGPFPRTKISLYVPTQIVLSWL